MNPLLYTVARGDPVFRAMARECIRSARARGYIGDFLALTDAAEPVHGADVAHLEAGPDQLAKAGLTRVLDRTALAEYDKILYVDADCVFTENPACLLEPDALRFAVETGGPIPDYNTVFLTPEERHRFRRAGAPHVNTGTILMPGPEAFDLLRAWETFWAKCPRHEIARTPRWRWCNPSLMDQPAMQAMLFRESVPWEPFPPGAIEFPVLTGRRDATLLHYCGPLNGGKTSHVWNKEAILEWMREKNEE
jgi:hypothetical protein